MKRALIRWFDGPKDIIATILVVSYSVMCLATALVPSLAFEDTMAQEYKDIILIVVGFYFGDRSGNRKCNFLDSQEGQ